jgi:pilus assembly protein Flp/PilA
MIMMAFKFLKRFARDEDGATAIEYGLFAALIAAILVATVQLLGVQVLSGFTTVLVALGGTAP